MTDQQAWVAPTYRGLADLLSTGIGGNGLEALGDAHRKNPSRMERLTQCRIIDAKVPRDRVEPELGGCLDTLDGALDLIEGYPLKAGQLTYDCRYSTMHGMPVTGGRGFRGLKPLWYNSVPP